MPAEKTKFVVGLFLLIGGTLCVSLFIWLGASKFFERGYTLVTYFDESVQGLNLDAPVKYRGVPVGRVVDIQVAPDYRLVEVAMEIGKDYHFQKNETQSLVATLKSIGITGSMYIELNRIAKNQIPESPQIDFPTKYPVIPSRPSNVRQIIDNVELMLNRVNTFDVQGVSQRIKTALDHFNQILSQTNTEEMSRNLEKILSGMDLLVNDPKWERLLKVTTRTGEKFGLMADRVSEDVVRVKSLFETIEHALKANEEVLSSTLLQLNATTHSAGLLMQESRQFVEQERMAMNTLHSQVLAMIRNLRDTSDQLLQLIDDLERQPSQLFFSKPPQPRKLQE